MKKKINYSHGSHTLKYCSYALRDLISTIFPPTDVISTIFVKCATKKSLVFAGKAALNFADS